MKMHCTNVLLLSGRRIPRRLAGARILDGEDGDEREAVGDVYRSRSGRRVVVTVILATGPGTILVSLWVSSIGRAGAKAYAADKIIPALTEAGRLLFAAEAVSRPAGRLGCPSVTTSPQAAALWPPAWRARLPTDGPELLPAAPGEIAAVGAAPTGEPSILSVVL